MTIARHGSLAMVTLGAALVTAGTGLVAEVLDGERPALANEREADDHARDDMLALGFRPPAAGPLMARGVEILHAKSGFELALGHGTISGGQATPERLEAATRVVRRELGRLPESFLARAELRRVVLAGELREGLTPIPSLPNYNRTLLLDADADEGYLRRLLHHEIFHFADLADDSSVLRDPAWLALNAPGFAYGQGGRSMREDRGTSHAAPPLGFVSLYATSGLEEDKAEVFAWLMTAVPNELAAREASDATLAAKAARVRAIARDLSPEMTAVLAR